MECAKSHQQNHKMTTVVILEGEKKLSYSRKGKKLSPRRAFGPLYCFLHAFQPEPTPTRKLSYMNPQFGTKGSSPLFRRKKKNNYESKTYKPACTTFRIGLSGLLEQSLSLFKALCFSFKQSKSLVNIFISSTIF